MFQISLFYFQKIPQIQALEIVAFIISSDSENSSLCRFGSPLRRRKYPKKWKKCRSLNYIEKTKRDGNKDTPLSILLRPSRRAMSDFVISTIYVH